MSLLKEKSYGFALTLVKSIYAFQKESKEFILTKQLIRSGTSVGAMIEEAGQAESKSDFVHKLSIANKEANETRYWLRLLRDSGIYTKSDIQEMLDQVDELIRMLVASIKTAKSK